MTAPRPRTLIRTFALAGVVGLAVVACVRDVGVAPQPSDPGSAAASALTSAQKATLKQETNRSTGVALPPVGPPSLAQGASALDLSQDGRRTQGAFRPSAGSPLYKAPPSQEPASPRTHVPLVAQMVGPTDRFVSVRSDFKITFNRPVNKSRAERGLHIEPAAAGQVEWLDDRTMRFQPEKFAYGTTYKVRVSGVGHDESNDSSWEWTFTTMKPLTLSFDDCPWSAAEGQKLLAFLRQNHIRALMFPTGTCNRQYPWLVPAMLADGHRVCNHTQSHPHLLRFNDAGISSEVAGGVHANCNLLRPPYGEWDGPGGRVERIAAQHGYRIQMWDVDTYDWAEASADRMLNQINMLGGGLILMHYQGKHTQEALRRLDMRDVVSVS